ncbi:MAG: hypothetical protein KA752_04070, partial [Giesbergeria sp.]|nr:hypothetical protein [Giesbergeria sp.]
PAFAGESRLPLRLPTGQDENCLQRVGVPGLQGQANRQTGKQAAFFLSSLRAHAVFAAIFSECR